jgi:hypothetical protein
MRRLGRFLAAAALVLGPLFAVSTAAMTSGAQPASAAGGTGCTGYNVGQSWAVTCGTDGTDGGGGGGSTTSCVLETIAAAFGPQTTLSDAYPEAPPGYVWLVTVCAGAGGDDAINLYKDGGALTPQILADQAYAELSPPALAIGTAPMGRVGLVGLPEWFWVDAAGYATLQKTAGLAGLSATVTATPGPLIISPGDGGATFTCPGPGTPYNASAPAPSQQSDCTFLYTAPSAGQPGNVFTVSISVTWTATWTGTGGTGGALAPITRTATIALPVAQAETVYSGG